MRAITVRQPFASEILSGKKTVEYRSFFTQTGDILICAGKADPENDGLPRGVALCVVRIAGFMYDVEYTDGTLATVIEIDGKEKKIIPRKAGSEVYSIGWLLEDLRPVEQIPIRGMPGIFHVDDKLIKFI